MHAFNLATAVWFRAQGIYAALHVFALIAVSLWIEIGGGDGAGSGILLLIMLYSCGLALVCGLPAWMAMTIVMWLAAPSAAKARVLLPTFLVVGLCATVGALLLAFRGALGGKGDTDGLDIFFGGVACASMVASVLSLHRSIAGLSDDLNGPQFDDANDFSEA